jgi:hypothetical protein
MTKLPAKAKQEITEQLLKHMEITPAEATAIFRRYGICEDPDILQERYLRMKVQQFLSSFRDEDGNRAVLAVRDANGVQKYTIVDTCSDLRALKTVRHGLHAQATGLKASEGKVATRIHTLEQMLERFRREARDT